jgi:hypothetical protein
LNRDGSLPERRSKVEAPAATECRSHHPPTEARGEARPTRGLSKGTAAHRDESGFGGWGQEKAELRRAAAPPSLAESIRASRNRNLHPQHLTIPPPSTGGLFKKTLSLRSSLRWVHFRCRFLLPDVGPFYMPISSDVRPASETCKTNPIWTGRTWCVRSGRSSMPPSDLALQTSDFTLPHADCAKRIQTWTG